MGTLGLASLLAFPMGAVLGLLGGGGGILAVPLLVYVVGLGAKPAIASSLFLIGTTSALGVALGARAGRVRWKLGGLFALGSMSGAFLGGRLAHFVPEAVLLGGLGTVMLATALAMLRGREEPPGGARPIGLVALLAIGAAVGLVSGLLGAGGGFLIVPVFTLLLGLSMREAIDTSLFVISLQSFAGFAGHLSHFDPPVALIAVLTLATSLGMVAGLALGKRVAAERLKRGFAGLLLATGLGMLGQKLPWPWTLAVSAVAITLAVLILRRRGRAAAQSKDPVAPPT